MVHEMRCLARCRTRNFLISFLTVRNLLRTVHETGHWYPQHLEAVRSIPYWFLGGIRTVATSYCIYSAGTVDCGHDADGVGVDGHGNQMLLQLLHAVKRETWSDLRSIVINNRLMIDFRFDKKCNRNGCSNDSAVLECVKKLQLFLVTILHVSCFLAKGFLCQT